MSIVSNSSSKADFSGLPQEVISDCVLPYLNYREASIASRTNRIMNAAFKNNDEFARQSKCIEGAVRDLETAVVNTIESHSRWKHAIGPSLLATLIIPNGSLIMPGEQIEIRIPSLRLVHRDMDWRDISIDLVDVRIRAIYKPTWDVRVFDGIHRNIVRLMGFLCSFIPLLPLIALSPIFIASSLACNIIKVFHSRKNSLEHFQVERIENVNSEHQTTEFIDLCLRKLDQVLNSKK